MNYPIKLRVALETNDGASHAISCEGIVLREPAGGKELQLPYSVQGENKTLMLKYTNVTETLGDDRLFCRASGKHILENERITPIIEALKQAGFENVLHVSSPEY